MKNQHVTFTAILFALTCFGLLPTPETFAVLPPPDGGYPGGNTAEGQNALLSLTTGGFNTAVGFLSLRSDTTSSFNTAVGAGTLFANTDGDNNTATGAGALFANGIGVQNTATGALVLFSNTTGNSNTANGYAALAGNTEGFLNTANGSRALYSNSTGNFNTADGYEALAGNTTGSINTALGYRAGVNVTTASEVICIGSAGANVTATTWIGGVYGAQTLSGTTAAVVISDFGQLGTVASSKRFKKDISAMDKASEIILSLRPVTFHYRSDKKETPQFGLVAEEVANVNPALVLPDKEGKPYTVRYEAVNAMLLNEFLKEHKKVEQQGREISKQNTIISELESTVARQQKSFQSKLAEQQNQIEALRSGLQKVSAQLEMMKPVTQMVINEP
jgi:hypothetical protein